MKVTVYGPLRSATGDKTVPVAFDGGTVSDALAAFVDAYPRARPQVYTDDGSVRPSVRLSVDGRRVDLEAKCPPDAELSVVPAVQGGSGAPRVRL